MKNLTFTGIFTYLTNKFEAKLSHLMGHLSHKRDAWGAVVQFLSRPLFFVYFYPQDSTLPWLVPNQLVEDMKLKSEAKEFIAPETRELHLYQYYFLVG